MSRAWTFVACLLIGLAVDAARPVHASARSATLPGPVELTRSRVEVTLPDGRRVTAHRRHLDAGADHVTWRGVFPESPESSLTLTAARGHVAGTLVHDGRTFELTRSADGGFLLHALEAADLPPPAPLRPRELQRRSTRSATPTVLPLGASVQASGDPAGGVVQDLLVVTTPRARAAHAPGELEGRIRNAVEDANAAYLGGGIGVTLRLVDVHEAAVSERAGMGETLEAVRLDADVAARRDASGADLVILVAEHADYCGVAYFMDAVDADFATHAYGVVAHACLANRTLAHEIGHLQGLAHDRETTAGDRSSSPYAFGYRDCRDGARDIMAYACTSGFASPVNRFSSPRTWIDGRPLGVDFELEPARAADAARALGDSAATVAAFRTLPVAEGTAPSSPADVTAVPDDVDVISVRWTPESPTHAAGFFVERTTDGVNWVRIATLEVPASGFADDTAAPDVVYSYRVRAWNATGVSAPSVVATARIDVTPEPLAFPMLRDVPLDRWVTSTPVTVRGINVALPLVVSGGEHSVGCTGTFSAAPAVVRDAEHVCLRHRSATSPSTTVTTTFTVGTTRTLEFSSTTTADVPGARAGGGATGTAALLPLVALAALHRRRRRADGRS